MAWVLVPDPPLDVTLGKSQTLKGSIFSFMKLGCEKKRKKKKDQRYLSDLPLGLQGRGPVPVPVNPALPQAHSACGDGSLQVILSTLYAE